MKNIFSLKSIVVVAGLFLYMPANATTILFGTETPGFTAHPQQKTFTLDSSGDMLLEIKDLQTSQTNVVRLGILTSVVVQHLITEINLINSTAPLVDQDAGQPQCTDTPSFTVGVPTQTGVKEIFRQAGCHKWLISNYPGRAVAQFVMTFLTL